MESVSQFAPALPGRVILRQRWTDLVFLHWRVEASVVAPLLPARVVPDLFDGSTWVGLIPFRMQHTRFAVGPAIPYFGSFTEINVRLYGRDASGRRGVVFRSLEASRLAAVLFARARFGLAYYWADVDAVQSGDRFEYAGTRRGHGPSTRIVATRTGRAVIGDPLADFLTGQWRLFVEHRGRTVVQANEHAPWPLFEATLGSLDDELLAAAGLPGLAGRAPDSVLYSPGVDVNFSGPSALALPHGSY
jgi:uncharacterized protein YqjF (DUF2071 family)